jgi:hypothetical protein
MKMVWFDLKEFCKSYEANKKNQKKKRRKENKNGKGAPGNQTGPDRKTSPWPI